MAVGLEDSLPDGGVGMNKEMLKQADEWLKSMLEIASVQKEADMIEHMKERIKVQKWLMEQAKRVKELEESLEHGAKVAVKTAEKLHYEQQQNKRYRELLLKIFKVTQNHQIEKISDYAFSRAGMLFYEWLGASGAIDLDRYCDEVNGHDNYDEYNIERMIDKMIKARKTLGESE